MQSIAKTWPENTAENKIKWAAMKNRPPEFRTLVGTIEEVKKFFANNGILSLPQICEEIAKLVDLLLCSGSRSWKEGKAEYAEETIKKIESKDDDFPFYILFTKIREQYWVVENYLRKYAPLIAEGLQKLSPTFNLSYLISYAAYAFHFRVGNCQEHANLVLTLLLLGGKEYLLKNQIYCGQVIILKQNKDNHAQVLLVRGKILAEIIKNYFLRKIKVQYDDWKTYLEKNYRIIENYEKAKRGEQIGEVKEAVNKYYDYLRGEEKIPIDIDKIYRELKEIEEENAYIADGFWGKGEHPKRRIEDPDTKHFGSIPYSAWGTIPDLKVLFSKILYDYKDFLLSS